MWFSSIIDCYLGKKNSNDLGQFHINYTGLGINVSTIAALWVPPSVFDFDIYMYFLV